MTEPAKTCTKCHVLKPLDEFPKDPYMNDGRSSWCRKCHAVAVNARKKLRYKTDPEYRKKVHGRIAKRAKQRYNSEPAFRRRMLDYQRKRNKPCRICGGPKEPHQKIYCKKCLPEVYGHKGGGVINCCNFLQVHHEEFKDDTEHLSSKFLKKLLTCQCEVPD